MDIDAMMQDGVETKATVTPWCLALGDLGIQVLALRASGFGA